MEKLDGEVQRIAKLRAWSETEGQRIIAAWRRSRSGQTRSRRYPVLAS